MNKDVKHIKMLFIIIIINLRVWWVRVHRHICAAVHTLKSESSSGAIFLLSPLMDSRDWTQIVWLTWCYFTHWVTSLLPTLGCCILKNIHWLLFLFSSLTFVCLILVVLYVFYTLTPCLKSSWQRFFSHSGGCLFTLLVVCFALQRLWNPIQVPLPALGVISFATKVLFRRSMPVLLSWDIFSLTLGSSGISGFTWRCLIHFEYIFMQDENMDLISFFCRCISRFASTIC